MSWILVEDVPQLASLLVLSGKAAVLLTLVVTIGAVLKRASAATRYFLTYSTIILAAVLPILAMMVPDTKLPLPMVIQSRLTTGTISSPPPTTPVGEAGLELISGITHAPEAHTIPASSQRRDIILFIWLLGTAVAAGRVFIGSIVCAGNRRNARQLDSRHIRMLVGRAATKIGLLKRPDVMISNVISVPHIYGIVNPVLVLPSNVINWPQDRLMSVLQHELAHVRRKDNVTWPLANLAASWLWFVPVLWVALAHMKRYKERACDDCVVACGNNEVNYAQHLLEVCASLRSTAGVVPISSLFSRKSEIKKRITYMLTNRISRKPISRIRKTVMIGLLLGLTVPLLSITGLSGPLPPGDATPSERKAATATLQGFYEELSNGSDYQAVKERYLSSGYFDDPSLTLENLNEAVRRPPFDNTLNMIRTAGVGVAREVHCRIISISRDRDELVVTQHVDVLADKFDGVIETYEGEVSVTRKASPAQNSESTVADCFIVKDLVQQIRLRKENGVWRIAKFDDGLALMRMDTDNPYGPIFLVWMENIDNKTTPFGPGVFKVFPRDLIPDARNTKFILEE